MRTTRSCTANKVVLQIEKKEEQREEGNDGETSALYKGRLDRKTGTFLINQGRKKVSTLNCIHLNNVHITAFRSQTGSSAERS